MLINFNKKIVLISVAVIFVTILQGCGPRVSIRSNYESTPVEKPLYTSLKFNQFDKVDDGIKPAVNVNASFDPQPDEGVRKVLAEAISKSGLSQKVIFNPSENDVMSDYMLSGRILQFSQNYTNENTAHTILVIGSPLIPILIIPALLVASIEMNPLESTIEVQIQLQDTNAQKILLDKVYKRHEMKKVNSYDVPGKLEGQIETLMSSLIEEVITDMSTLNSNVTALVP